VSFGMLERRSLGDGLTALVSASLERHGFLVAFTERTGGTSPPPFDTMNLSAATGDDALAVVRNRTSVCSALDVEPFAVLHQVHGSTCVRVDPAGAGSGFDPQPGREPPAPADAMVTVVPGASLGILVADCVPIALASAAEGRIAAVHAGWRGLAAGVVTAALAAFTDPSTVRAAIGPAIGPDHYEVGEEVVDAVTAMAGRATLARHVDGRFRLDLAGTAAGLLRALGVREVEEAGLCTACEPKRFYSHRRDGPATGRQALIAAIRP
jgi:purine-nucleoside/S-methyl-5'-thioadenosine phosphorylase / adenosine deaminase